MLELECRHDLCLEPLSNLGEFCIIDAQCYDPLICNPELFACTDPPKKIGELCDLDTDYCDVGLVCAGDLFLTCSIPPEMVDQQCSITEDCEEGFICTDEVCVTLKTFGDSCVASSECLSELICDGGIC